LGVIFYTTEELRLNNEIADCLKDAFEIIKHVPSLFKTVNYLVKSIHLVKPEDDEYDISFSEPHIPFSIFISVPKSNNPVNALRVAESIVHEAMHLQLTLMENIISLAMPSEKLHYSPWKIEFRSIDKIMHALYVFRAIDKFLETLQSCIVNSIKQVNFLSVRRTKINEEINQIKPFGSSASLTSIGLNFVNNLILNEFKYLI
jgi:HEXXH motif-containing protein